VIRRIALFDRKGMTLIEVLVATFLFLIVALALLQTSIISVDHNALGNMREEAVRVAELRMNDARTIPFTSTVDNLTGASDSDHIAGCPSGFPADGVKVERKIGNATVAFCTNLAVSSIGDDVRQIVVRVDWKWKGIKYTHSISSIVRRL
jgi:prepilin-type N-terminal cleavage/methylation domain-containing protein